MKIHQFFNSNEEFLANQMKSLTFIEDTNNYIQQQSQKNYCQIKFEKPLFKLNISDKFEKLSLLPSDVLKPPRTAPPNSRLSLKKSAKTSRVSSPPISSLSSSTHHQMQLPIKNYYIKSSTKEKDIKEWAFKKFNIESLLKIPTDQHVSQQTELKKLSAKSRFYRDIWPDDIDDDPHRNMEDIDLAKLENPDEDAEFYRNHRSTNINKAENKKNFANKLLDAKLVDLSRQRYKGLKNLEFQKKIFARKQMYKAKLLPGLKCDAILDQLHHDEKKALEQSIEESFQNKYLNKRNSSIIKNESGKRYSLHPTAKLVSFASKLDQIENETINETQRHLRSIQVDLTNTNINESDTQPVNSFAENSYRKRINSKYSISSSLGDLFEQFTNQQNEKEVAKRQVVSDKRFFYLINTVKPSYKLGKTMKDVNKIIEKNDALKSTNFDKETIKKMQTVKKSGTKLAISARKLLATSDYPD